jgi:uncharacterized protein
MKRISVLALLVISMTSAFGQSANNSSYKATLKKMLEVAGTETTFKAAIKQMFGMFKQQNTKVPENVWAEFEAEFSKTSISDLVNMLEPVYAKHMTEADLNKIIEFYQTPVGKKYAEKTPFILQESMQVGQTWGMQMGQKFQEKLKEKGY